MDNPQEAHYVGMHDAYGAHYYDRASLRYRDKFLFDPLLEGVDLADCRVADVACGSGYNSLLLRNRFPTAQFEGFDISPKACADYQRLLGSSAHHVDFTLPVETHEGAFDAAVVIGGLHHCVTDLPTVFSNLGRIVRPGGRLLFWEPNARFFLQKLRDYWYRKDGYFEEDTERALTLEEITQAAAPYFRCTKVRYFGGPAYFLILNSLVTRVPLSSKDFIAPPLFVAETIWNSLKQPMLFPTISGIWART